MNISGNTSFINKVIKVLKRKLDQAKFRHSLGVACTARALAEKFSYPADVAYLAGLLHDFGRAVPVKSYRRFFGGALRKPLAQNLFLLHGEVSAILGKRLFGVRNRKIFQAIRRHTLGAPFSSMTKLDKIIFLADAIAPDRRFPFVKKLRSLAFRDLDRAVFFACQNKLIYVLKKRKPLELAGVRTYNSFLLKCFKKNA